MAKLAVLKEVVVTLPMAPEMEVAACEKASVVAESMGMSPDKINEVKMAVIEAIDKMANKISPKKPGLPPAPPKRNR